MLSTPTTGFINRLRGNDQAAWFELWETFGPVVRAQLMKWGRGKIGAETVQDLSQETLAALSDSIDRFDPTRGARFSTWLLAIAKHVLGDEMDRRMAQKRGQNKRPDEFDETWMRAAPGASVDAQYEAAVFRAKVEAAIRMVQRESDFTDFSIYSMRVLESKSGREVADALGMSEATVSRRLAKVREALRRRLVEVIAIYSFTEEERGEAARNGLAGNPNKGDAKPPCGPEALAGGDAQADANFDECIGEIYHRQMELRRLDQARRLE